MARGFLRITNAPNSVEAPLNTSQLESVNCGAIYNIVVLHVTSTIQFPCSISTKGKTIEARADEGNVVTTVTDSVGA